MEVAAPKGRAGPVLPGVLTVVNRPVPSHLPRFISRPRLHRGSDRSNLPHLSESLPLLERHCSCRDQCGSVGCLFVSYQSASGTILCVCVHARMCVFVLLCSSVMLRFCFFSPWVRVNLPVYPGLKVTHSHFGTPRASTVQLRSQTDLRTSSKIYQHNLFVCCSVCGCVFKERKGMELAWFEVRNENISGENEIFLPGISTGNSKFLTFIGLWP